MFPISNRYVRFCNSQCIVLFLHLNEKIVNAGPCCYVFLGSMIFIYSLICLSKCVLLVECKTIRKVKIYMHSNIASSKQIVSWIVENSLMVIVNRQISKRCAMVGNNTWYLSSHCSFVWVVLMNNFFPGRPSIVARITIWDHALSSPVHQKICLKYGALMGPEHTTSI